MLRNYSLKTSFYYRKKILRHWLFPTEICKCYQKLFLSTYLVVWSATGRACTTPETQAKRPFLFPRRTRNFKLHKDKSTSKMEHSGIDLNRSWYASEFAYFFVFFLRCIVILQDLFAFECFTFYCWMILLGALYRI